MADNGVDSSSAPGEVSETNKISFEAYHKPGIASGTYSLQAQLDFSIGSSTPINQTFQANTLEFEVSSPRFSLSPAEVYAVFPPRDSLGEFDTVFPHIEINRSTLPWERSAGKKNLPWLCLILLQEDELTDTAKVNVASKAWTDLRDSLALPEESSDEPDDEQKPFPPVKLLTVEKSFLEAILPTAEDLNWLTHVRVGHDQHGEKFERAILVCNRMPKAGSKAEVHLISLEGKWKNDSFSEAGISAGKIPVLSLLSWQFTCPDTEEFKVSQKAIDRLPKELKETVAKAFPTTENKDTLYRGKNPFKDVLKEKGIISLDNSANDNKILSQLLSACHSQTETFKGLMDGLDIGWFSILPENDNTPGTPFFQAGSVPMAHGLRQGGKTVSWYRGPFVATSDLSNGFSPDLPARNADQLLLYDKTTNMLDTAYAAAWELGRLLTIGQPRISQQIAQWKTSHAREASLARQNLAFGHIPFTDSDFVHEKDGQLDQNLQHYFADLSLLNGLPFHYLVPHEKLLPHESLRFFHLDDRWIEALLDGAFSIGRTTQLDTTRVQPGTGPHENARPQLTGILLRSDLVSGWPSLLIEGYTGDGDELKKEDKLTAKRFERVGPTVLLVLFEKVLTRLTIHLPAESLHFGFSPPLHDGEAYFKELKSLEDGSEIMAENKNVSIPISWRNNRLRVFDPQAFVASINEEPNNKNSTDKVSIFHAGQLAVELLEGVPSLLVKVF